MYVRRREAFIEVQAPAKVNLFLEILGRRADGYHEIETLMMPISVCDTLRLSVDWQGGLRLCCAWAAGCEAQRAAAGGPGAAEWEVLPQGEDNLVVKALERLRAWAGLRCGATVRLIKRIPAAAGLGGASSDAAAALAAANTAWGLGWSRSRLAEVAAEVGSDVPFFLYGGPAVCRGRGERIEPLSHGPRWSVVVARPPAGLSTAQVYRHCQVAATPRGVAGMVEAVEAGCATRAAQRLFNRLQSAAEQLSPWIARLRAAFERLDCLGHQLSGSGTSYFGICRHARQARRMAAQLRAANLGAVFAATTGGSWSRAGDETEALCQAGGEPSEGGASWRSPRFA
jgi:4-diphosphocytidyl-2-C-methyl-D-erythritol kinase